MYVSFRVGVIFINVLASVAVGDKTFCEKNDWYDFVDDSCITVNYLEKNNRPAAHEQCRRKSNSRMSWELVLMDTPQKKTELYNIFNQYEYEVDTLFAFWINLERGGAATDMEARNLDEWKNLTRWWWRRGQREHSKLDTWPQNVPLPWAPSEPDNYDYRRKDYHNATDEKTERCVMAVQNGDEENQFDWYDMLCDSLPDWTHVIINDGDALKYVVVCQGTKKPDTPTPTKNDANKKNQNGFTTPTSPLLWPWIVGGLAIALVLVFAVVVVLACYIRRRRRKSRHHRRTVHVSNSPSSRSQSERDDSRRHVDDESSRRQRRSDRFPRRHSDKKPTEMKTKSGSFSRRHSDKTTTEKSDKKPTKTKSGRRDRSN